VPSICKSSIVDNFCGEWQRILKHFAQGKSSGRNTT
jgi:hypothetical protein